MNNKRTLVSVLVILLVFSVVFAACAKFNETEESKSTKVVSQEQPSEQGTSAPVSEESTSETETAKKDEKTTEKKTAEASTASTEAKTSSAKSYSTGMSVEQALNLLSEHYGKGYEVNGIIGDGETYSFAVYKDGNSYAKVKVNLTTGTADETITETSEHSTFELQK